MARRLGQQVDDPDLESRLQRIEYELTLRQLANFEGSTFISPDTKEGLPLLTGLRLGSGIPGSVLIEWNPAPLRDIRYYEVNVSNNVGFNTDESKNQFSKLYKVPQASFVFPETFDPDATWYVRVRYVTSQGVRSGWTLPLSTESGRVVKVNEAVETYSLLDPNPRGGLFSGDVTFFNSIQAATGHPNNDGTSGTYGSADVIWKGGLFIPFIIMEYDFCCSWAWNNPNVSPSMMTIQFWRVFDITDFETNGPSEGNNYNKINDITLTFPSNIGFGLDSFGLPLPGSFRALSRQTVSSFGEPDDIALSNPNIAPGTLIGYRINVTVDSQGAPLSSIYFRPNILQMQMIEVRT